MNERLSFNELKALLQTLNSNVRDVHWIVREPVLGTLAHQAWRAAFVRARVAEAFVLLAAVLRAAAPRLAATPRRPTALFILVFPDSQAVPLA